MRKAYLKELANLAEENKDILSIISDSGIVVYDEFKAKFPQQCLNLGISESNIVGVAAGLASCGKITFVDTAIAFLVYRAYEFIRNDVCLQNQNVKLIGAGAGLITSKLGATHHGTEDLALLRVLPHLTIFSPASPLEVRKATRAAYEITGPVYIRLGNNNEREIYNTDYEFHVGKGNILKKGSDIAVFGTGSIIADILEVVEDLEVKENLSIMVINIATIKPFDRELISQVAKKIKKIVVIEEHNTIGGLGSAVAEVLSEIGEEVKLKRMGLKESFGRGYGTHQEIKDNNKIGKKDMKLVLKNIYQEK